jgi:integrase/recombinase XerD
MTEIILRPLHHQNKNWIGIHFKHQVQLNNVIQKQAGAKWSITQKCWYIPLTRQAYKSLATALSGKAILKNEDLKITVQKSTPAHALSINNPKLQKTDTKEVQFNNPQICETNKLELKKYLEEMKLKMLSASTIKTYKNEFSQLLQTINQKPVFELTAEQLKRYMVFAIEKQGINENTAHSRLNAIKFYFEQVLKGEKFFWEIPRPKKTTELPKTFNQEEIAGIINSLKNKKHKAMLMLAYSAGLRVSEVVALKTFEIDSKRMTIFIRQAKGKKDRMVALSPVLLVMLREYAMEYKPSKNGYLFEGTVKGTAYSTRSLQEVLHAAKNKAGVLKPGSIHALRHSFATHLVDKGTDVTMIQKLLGHNDLKTTLRYLHTSNKDLLKIISPLDDLKLT